MKLGVQEKKVTASDSAKPGPHIHIIFFESGVTSTCVCDAFFVGVYLQGAWSLLAQIWYGAFYIWGIDVIKFLWRLGEGVGG